MSHFDNDRDGFLDHFDNAPARYNPDQRDSDGDRLGDVEDPSPSDPSLPTSFPDIDADGISDIFDNAPFRANSNQADADGDGVGDIVDNALNRYNPFQADADEDGLGDIVDSDDDNDGIIDAAENPPRLVTPIPDLVLNEGDRINIELYNAFRDEDAARPDSGDFLRFEFQFDTDADGQFDDAMPTSFYADTFKGYLYGAAGEELGGTTVGVWVNAFDQAGQRVSDQFSIAIQEVNNAPVGGRSRFDSLIEDTPSSIDFAAGFVDPEGDSFSLSVSYDTDGDREYDDARPQWLDDNSGRLSGVADDRDFNSFNYRVTATDARGASSSTESTVYISQAVDDPAVFATPVPDVTLEIGDRLELLFGKVAVKKAVEKAPAGEGGTDGGGLVQVRLENFVKDDGYDTLSFGITYDTDGDGVFDDAAPDWFEDIGNGSRLGTPDAADVGMFSVSVSVSDGFPNDIHDVFTITVRPDGIFGGEGSDTIEGTTGGDLLDGGRGPDKMAGGRGDDTYEVDDLGDLVTELPGEGRETVRAGIDYILPENVENLELTGSGPRSGTGNGLSNEIRGNDSDNALDGGEGDDSLSGGSGNDKLLGGAGNDVLDGGTGRDVMTGGEGDDVYVLDGARDRIRERNGEGADSVQSSQSFRLDSNLENLELTGTGAANGKGNNGANAIIGNGAANVLAGGGGNDTLDGAGGGDLLIGGNGDDVLTGGAGADVFVFKGKTGDDVILDFEDGVDLLRIDNGKVDTQWIGNHVQDAGSDTVIDFGDNQVVLEGVSASSIGLGDFLIG